MEWISVNDRLPELGSKILVAIKEWDFLDKQAELTVHMAEFVKSFKGDRTVFEVIDTGGTDTYDIKQIEGWMPLPPPPTLEP